MAKYIFVTGGVVSSLGKGIAAASIGCLLESRGVKVTCQKFDPYLNVDPGTMSPFQHGEVYVLEDGAETDAGAPGGPESNRRSDHRGLRYDCARSRLGGSSKAAVRAIQFERVLRVCVRTQEYLKVGKYSHSAFYLRLLSQ